MKLGMIGKARERMIPARFRPDANQPPSQTKGPCDREGELGHLLERERGRREREREEESARERKKGSRQLLL
jgi:hypothetical protein